MANISQNTISYQIFEKLRDKITANEIKAGEKIILREIQKEFGVSSTPVRDALAMLNAEGFLEYSRNTAAKIIVMDEKDVEEFREVLQVLNGAVIKMAMEYDCDKLLMELKSNLAIYKTMKEMNNIERLASVGNDFNNCVYENCGNQTFFRLVDPLYGKFKVLFHDYIGILTEDNILESMELIVENVEKRDIEAAQEEYKRYGDLWFLNLEKKR